MVVGKDARVRLWSTTAAAELVAVPHIIPHYAECVCAAAAEVLCGCKREGGEKWVGG